MTDVTGEIIDIYLDGGSAKAAVRVGGAVLRVPLTLLMEARVGDMVVVQSGMAVSKTGSRRKRESAYVSGSAG